MAKLNTIISGCITLTFLSRAPHVTWIVPNSYVWDKDKDYLYKANKYYSLLFYLS